VLRRRAVREISLVVRAQEPPFWVSVCSIAVIVPSLVSLIVHVEISIPS
jgi:hypothetical protein